MFDRIVHQPLQKQVRDLRIQRFGSNFENRVHPLFESDFFDFKVTVHALEFAAESSDLGVCGLEANAQQVAETAHHSVGSAHIGEHKGGNRMHRVKEEVGLQLALQRLQADFGQLCFELGRPKFSLPVPVVLQQSMRDQNNRN